MSSREEIKVMSAQTDTFSDYFKKIWKFRSLILVFAKRDLKVKYAQTAIGLGWTIIQPLVAFLIFTFFFGFLLNWKTDGIDYPVYVLSGLLGWNLFSYIVNSGTFGMQESAHLMKKIYFPKSIIPLSKVLIAFVELAFSFLLLIPLMIYYGQTPSWNILFLPFVIVFNTVCALLLVFWIATFAYKKRDVLHLIPFLLYFGIWFSPVFFSKDILPQQYTFLLDLNPMANVIDAWRWSLFGYGDFQWIWIVNFLLMSLLLLIGMFLYNKREDQFADFS